MRLPLNNFFLPKADLCFSQAEQMDKMTSISLKMMEVVILSVAQLVTTVISSQLEISHMLNGTTPEIQLKK